MPEQIGEAWPTDHARTWRKETCGLRNKGRVLTVVLEKGRSFFNLGPGSVWSLLNPRGSCAAPYASISTSNTTGSDTPADRNLDTTDSHLLSIGMRSRRLSGAPVSQGQELPALFS
jgi:hypothetical protein